MNTISKLLAGTGILVAIYLFVKNATGTASIIDTLGSVYADGVKTLQGRG